MQFAVDRTAVHGRPALRVRGEFDIATAPRLAECVEAELATSPRALVVDLTETTFMDSSGARQIVRTARRVAEAGATLQVVCPRQNTSVRLVIDLLELDRLVPVVEQEQAGRADGEVGS